VRTPHRVCSWRVLFSLSSQQRMRRHMSEMPLRHHLKRLGGRVRMKGIGWVAATILLALPPSLRFRRLAYRVASRGKMWRVTWRRWCPSLGNPRDHRVGSRRSLCASENRLLRGKHEAAGDPGCRFRRQIRIVLGLKDVTCKDFRMQGCRQESTRPVPGTGAQYNPGTGPPCTDPGWSPGRGGASRD
jgi:hypothetical protein